MMAAKVSLAFILGLSLGLSAAGGQNRTLENVSPELLKGMPEDVVDLITRVDGCVHWTGEEPFDDERASQIQQAVLELKCHDLQKDVKTLSQQHSGAEPVLKALDFVAKEFLVPSFDPFETERLIQDMPPDVVDLVLRADQCVVYQHEQSSDDALAGVKKMAMEALRCKDMRTDLIWFLDQYASSEPVSKTLKRLNEHYLHEGKFVKSP